jgi:hypothetical protein
MLILDEDDWILNRFEKDYTFLKPWFSVPPE